MAILPGSPEDLEEQVRKARHALGLPRKERKKDGITRSAIISPCGRYRYRLGRSWEDGSGRLVWLMFSPGKADAEDDDPTVYRVVKFTRLWGYQEAVVVNLYALCATDRAELFRSLDPVGPDNDQHLLQECTDNLVLAAWGRVPQVKRLRAIKRLLEGKPREVWCLGLTDRDQPRHIMGLGSATLRQPFIFPTDNMLNSFKERRNSS